LTVKAGSTILATPQLRILSRDQKETLFLRVLETLEHTGVQVDNEEGLALLSGAGAWVGSKRHVHIPSHLVEDALAAAPRRITIYNRLGQPVVSLEDHQVAFCSQVDSIYFFDPFTSTPSKPLDHNRRLCVRADARLGAILCDALPNIDMVSLVARRFLEVLGRSWYPFIPDYFEKHVGERAQ
jgi:trimethylamine--corrinoid protein Co-methyltransferase